MPAEVVVFDLGKVLLDFDYRIAAAKLASRCRIPECDLKHLIDQSPLLYRYETNLLSTDQFFAEVQAASGFDGDLNTFRDLFGDIFTPIKPMVGLHATLRARSIPTYVFSNTNPLAVQHIRQRYPFFSQFDGYILSCDHNSMKPDPKIYEIVEQKTGKKGSQLLYIDDRPENVQAGAKRGWQAILHVSPEQTIAAVRRAGLLGS